VHCGAYLPVARLHRIDELFGKLQQARAQNRKLEQECERLASMIANNHHSKTHAQDRKHSKHASKKPYQQRGPVLKFCSKFAGGAADLNA
jgi:hypothetical protein